MSSPLGRRPVVGSEQRRKYVITLLTVSLLMMGRASVYAQVTEPDLETTYFFGFVVEG
jgi:hypothetical protein